MSKSKSVIDCDIGSGSDIDRSTNSAHDINGDHPANSALGTQPRTRLTKDVVDRIERKQKVLETKRKMFEQVTSLSFIYAYFNEKNMYCVRQRKFILLRRDNLFRTFFNFNQV